MVFYHPYQMSRLPSLKECESPCGSSRSASSKIGRKPTARIPCTVRLPARYFPTLCVVSQRLTTGATYGSVIFEVSKMLSDAAFLSAAIRSS